MIEKQDTHKVFYSGGEKSNEAILYLHGWGDCSIYHSKVPTVLERFEKAGFAVFSAPYSGLLGQPGEFNFYSMLDDAINYIQTIETRFKVNSVTVIGNCVGGLTALAAAAESDLVDTVVTMNSLFGFSDERWWYEESEYQNRAANWQLIEMGEDGPYGTEFNGLTEQFFKEKVCRAEHEDASRFFVDERADEFAHKDILLMTSYKDTRVDPLHTWTAYKHIRNAQAKDDVDNQASIRVIRKEDPFHTLLLRDEELQERVIDWLKES